MRQAGDLFPEQVSAFIYPYVRAWSQGHDLGEAEFDSLPGDKQFSDFLAHKIAERFPSAIVRDRPLRLECDPGALRAQVQS